MQVVGHWEPGLRGYRRLHFAVPGRRRRWRLIRGLGAALALAAGSALVFAGSDTTAWVDLAAGLLLVVGGDLLLARRWRRLRSAGAPVRFEISDHGVGVGNGTTEVLVHPAALVRSDTLREVWLFHPAAGAPLAVPRRAFDAADATLVDIMLTERGFDAAEHPTRILGAVGSRHVLGELALDFGEYRRIYQGTSGGRGATVRGLMFVAAVLLILLMWPPGFGGSYLAAAGGPAAVALYEVLLLRDWNRMKPMTAQPWTYDFSEAGVMVRTPLTDMTFRWKAVASVRRRSDAWLFKLRDGESIPIPKAAFPLDAEAAHVDLLIDYWELGVQ
jgi:hypothetical protein